MSQRKFYRSLHLVQAVSEDEFIEHLDLEALAREIDSGGAVGQVWASSDEINAAKAAQLLTEMASDPGFFQLAEDGSEEDDQEDEPAPPTPCEQGEPGV